jgi:putative NIF3 family GTP cyclohydrolase 1 type 2
MTVRLRDVVSFLDVTLDIKSFRDYGPNGLQVEGCQEVDRVVTAVSANAAVIRRAIELGADLIVVHHGLIWGAGPGRITGVIARRLKLLLEAGISLAAYHLPLDKHPRLGNNVGLCDAIGLGLERDAFGDVRGHALGVTGAWPAALSRPRSCFHAARTSSARSACVRARPRI